MLQLQSILLVLLAASSLIIINHAALGFQYQQPATSAAAQRRGGAASKIDAPTTYRIDGIFAALTISCPHHHLGHTCGFFHTKLDMVRNVDLPEALVFYGAETVMEQRIDESDSDGSTHCVVLRPGIARILNECQEVGTVALILSEELEDHDESLSIMFEKAWRQSPDEGLRKLMDTLLSKSDEPVVHFRCLVSDFVIPTSNFDKDVSSDDEEYDESIEFYNLRMKGRSPSPAFLLDSLRSVHIDPRGFGGSSGFGRGQWVEPRRSPMPARTVVFIAGDPVSSDPDEGGERSAAKDRCASARAAGCRLVYLEQLPPDAVAIQDDAQTMALCDAVIDTYGNDNPRDLRQPVTLDAVSTPGDYWLNPPNPRDDEGNRVAVDEVVEWFRSRRTMDDPEGDGVAKEAEEDEMSEEEMNRILADLDGL